MNRKWIGVLMLAALAAGLSGCELAGWFAGRGKAAPIYTIPPKTHVLVLVDLRPGVTAPPSFATELADQIGSHLFRFHAVDMLVGQDRVLELQRDPVKFRKMMIGDIADAVGADVVLAVNIVALDVTETEDKNADEAAAQVLIKVIDGHAGPGRERLWPGELNGYPVEATLPASFETDRDKNQAYKDLQDLLTVRIGRIFHEWDKDDKAMKR